MASYIIVGAGVFGVSTAYHLAKNHPRCSIILIDRSPCPHPAAASSDLNKIIRADYGDIFYMRLALEALHAWNTDPLYKPYFHETGMLFAENIGMGDASFSNYKTLGVESRSEILSTNEARQRFPIFRNANWTDVKDNYYNPCSGWGEADPAMRAMIKATLSERVEYLQATVQTLLFDDQGACVGIKTVDGQELKSEKVLLCTGASTAQFLADSAPKNKDLQVHGRMVAAAATSCIVRCDDEHAPKYRNAPVHFLGMPHTHGESIPMTSEGKLKFNFEVSFTNMVHHESSGQMISMLPTALTQSTWSHDVPEQLKKSLRTVIDHVYGKDAPGLTIESYRMCWDAVTPNQDFIISPHPACKGLYIAGGGSFHSWKFLPTIGKYVSKMLHEQLSPEEAEKWAWDRKNDGAACEMYIPQMDLKDFTV